MQYLIKKTFTHIDHTSSIDLEIRNKVLAGQYELRTSDEEGIISPSTWKSKVQPQSYIHMFMDLSALSISQSELEQLPPKTSLDPSFNVKFLSHQAEVEAMASSNIDAGNLVSPPQAPQSSSDKGKAPIYHHWSDIDEEILKRIRRAEDRALPPTDSMRGTAEARYRDMASSYSEAFKRSLILENEFNALRFVMGHNEKAALFDISNQDATPSIKTPPAAEVVALSNLSPDSQHGPNCKSELFTGDENMNQKHAESEWDERQAQLDEWELAQSEQQLKPEQNHELLLEKEALANIANEARAAAIESKDKVKEKETTLAALEEFILAQKEGQLKREKTQEAQRKAAGETSQAETDSDRAKRPLEGDGSSTVNHLGDPVITAGLSSGTWQQKLRGIAPSCISSLSLISVLKFQRRILCRGRYRGTNFSRYLRP